MGFFVGFFSFPFSLWVCAPQRGQQHSYNSSKAPAFTRVRRKTEKKAPNCTLQPRFLPSSISPPPLAVGTCGAAVLQLSHLWTKLPGFPCCLPQAGACSSACRGPGQTFPLDFGVWYACLREVVLLLGSWGGICPPRARECLVRGMWKLWWL